MAKTPPTKANLIRSQGSAFRLNKRFGVSEPGELQLEDVAMALGVLVVIGKLDGAAARLVRRGKSGVARISDTITIPGARRFAIAHEVGHWELHAEYSQFFLCTEADMHDYERSPLEIEANNFASELLMPTSLFRPFCENADPSLTLVAHLAEQFKASLTATAIRFVNETRHRCIVASSDSGRVKWWKRREDGTKLWLAKEQPIHPHSMAWECFKGVDVPDRVAPVPVEAIAETNTPMADSFFISVEWVFVVTAKLNAILKFRLANHGRVVKGRMGSVRASRAFGGASPPKGRAPTRVETGAEARPGS